MKHEAILKVLTEGTQEPRAVFVARYEEMSMARLRQQREALAANNWDLNKVAPEGLSTKDGRREYRMKQALRASYKVSFKETPETEKVSYFDRHRAGHNFVCVVMEREDAERRVRSAAKIDANACFDAFLFKQAGKIAEHTAEGTSAVSAELKGIIWDGCTLTVKLSDESVQVWTTKCILNQSVYGKLFNQWPSRLNK